MTACDGSYAKLLELVRKIGRDREFVSDASAKLYGNNERRNRARLYQGLQKLQAKGLIRRVARGCYEVVIDGQSDCSQEPV